MSGTWNPSDKGSVVTLSNGNLTEVSTPGAGLVRGTVGLSSGKQYFEVTIGSATYIEFVDVGIATSIAGLNQYVGYDAYGWGYTDGEFLNNNASAGSPAYFNNGDVLMFAVDLDAGKLWFGVNGVWYSGDPATGTNPVYTASFGTVFPAAGGGTTTANFGATSFAYTIPSGFSAWGASVPTPFSGGLAFQPMSISAGIIIWAGNLSFQPMIMSAATYPFIVGAMSFAPMQMAGGMASEVVAGVFDGGLVFQSMEFYGETAADGALEFQSLEIAANLLSGAVFNGGLKFQPMKFNGETGWVGALEFPPIAINGAVFSGAVFSGGLAFKALGISGRILVGQLMNGALIFGPLIIDGDMQGPWDAVAAPAFQAMTIEAIMEGTTRFDNFILEFDEDMWMPWGIYGGLEFAPMELSATGT